MCVCVCVCSSSCPLKISIWPSSDWTFSELSAPMNTSWPSTYPSEQLSTLLALAANTPPPPVSHVTIIWFYLIISWPVHYRHMRHDLITWTAYDWGSSNDNFTWSSHDNNMTVSHDHYMTVTWLSHDCHMMQAQSAPLWRTWMLPMWRQWVNSPRSSGPTTISLALSWPSLPSSWMASERERLYSSSCIHVDCLFICLGWDVGSLFELGNYFSLRIFLVSPFAS